MRSWKDFLIGIAVGSGVLVLLVVGYFWFGFAPVGVAASPMPMERYLAHAAMQAKIEDAQGTASPIESTEENLLAGARVYHSSCAACHGLPGTGKTAFQRGMYPQPPDLLTGQGVTDDSVGEIHWVVQHGIRMSGMPSFEKTFSDEQLWQVTQLVKQAHNLPGSVQELLRREAVVEVGETGSRPR